MANLLFERALFTCNRLLEKRDGVTVSDREEASTLKLTLLLNVSQCFLKLENWAKTISHCDAAIAIDSDSGKAFFRRAMAYEKLGKKNAFYGTFFETMISCTM